MVASWFAAYPEVQLIKIGEILCRVIGKAVCMATRSDIEVVCGVDQLCADLRVSIEDAIHAMSDLFYTNFDSVDGWGVLLVDASNVFNSLNWIAMLLHAHMFCVLNFFSILTVDGLHWCCGAPLNFCIAKKV